MNSGQQTLESMSQAAWYNQWTLGKFKSFLKGRILEVGCGIGNFTQTLTKFGEVWAIDIDKDYIGQSQQLIKSNTKVGIGDIEKGKYFFGDIKFDSVVCINVLEHIKDDKRALKNIYNLLAQGGYLILIVPIHKFLYGEIDKSIGHFRRYSKKEIKDKLKDERFKLVINRKINFLGGIGWFVSSKIFTDKTVSENKIKIFNWLAPFFLTAENFLEPPMGTSILLIAKK